MIRIPVIFTRLCMNISQMEIQLRSAQHEQQVHAILHAYLKTFAIHSYAFTYYSGHIKTGQKLRYHCVSEALRVWHEYYLEQKFADVDRTLEEYYATILPCYWDVQAQLTKAKNNRERRVRLESIEFGIDKGLSIPIHGPDRDFVSLTLHQRRGEKCLENYLELQYEWLAAAKVIYHHIKRILMLSETQDKHAGLTRREKQCLILTAKSWRVENIAKELNISVRTVNFHLQNANKKLGTHNKYQTVNKYLGNSPVVFK